MTGEQALGLKLVAEACGGGVAQGELLTEQGVFGALQ